MSAPAGRLVDSVWHSRGPSPVFARKVIGASGCRDGGVRERERDRPLGDTLPVATLPVTDTLRVCSYSQAQLCTSACVALGSHLPCPRVLVNSPCWNRQRQFIVSS